MFANRVAVILIAPALLFLYLAWVVDESWAPWIVPFVIAAVIVYILSPQINWWWAQKYPPDLSPGLISMLERFCGYYKDLPPLEKKRFRSRVALYRMATDWTPMGFPEDELPPDIEVAIASQAAILTFYREGFLFKQFEKIIIYPDPFPSPEFPFPHTSELYPQDGCLIFSARHLMQAFIQPERFYNIALHEYAQVFMLAHPEFSYPEFQEPEDWDKLAGISGLQRSDIELQVGLAGIPVLPVAIHHYFLHSRKFREALPDAAAAFDRIFNRPAVVSDDTLLLYA